MHAPQQVAGNDEKVMQYKAFVLRVYLLYLVDMSVLMDKSVTCVDGVYLRYFADFERIYDYNLEALVWSTCTLSYMKVVCGRPNKWQQLHAVDSNIFASFNVYVSFS